MFKHTKLCSGLLLAFGGLAFVSGTAIAQETKSLDRVVVTGSNIPRAEVEGPSPVQVITGEELKKSGYTTVSEVLRDITANGQGTLSQGFNQAFAAGASGISLRGLTVGATLVLIDGHRMAPYPLSDDGQRPFVDISSIPFSVVERIEILKDGASAVYGSDAIAGVVNVILKKTQDGVLVTADTGTTTRGGGKTSSASVTAGFGDADGTNGYVALEWRKQDEIKLAQRSGDWTNLDWRGVGGNNLNPGAVNSIVTVSRVATPYLQIPGSATNAANTAFYPGCNFADMKANNCTYQNSWAQLQPNSSNVNLIGRLNTRLGADWDLSFTASLFDSKNQQTRAPATVSFGSFAGTTATGPGITPTIVGALSTYTVPANYPGNTLGVPANIRAIFPLSDFNGRVEDVDTKSTRFVVDLSGTAGGWDIKGALGYTKVETQDTYTGYVIPGNLLIALNSPTNPFLLTGGNSAANLNFVAPQISATVTDELSFAEARASRELFKMDGGPFSIGMGLSTIYKKLNAPNPLVNQQGVENLSSAYALGNETNTSFYAEFVAPVVKSFEIDGAMRWDHYDTYGNSATPKLGFKFTPVKEFALRGTVSQGFRAPSAAENGNAGSQFSFNAIRDPQNCPVSNADGTPNTTSAANVPTLCNFTPIYLQNTNKNLEPEKSKSFTFGLLLEPIPQWSTTLDYYKIQIDNQIIPASALGSFDPLASAVRGTQQQVTFGDGHTGLSPAGVIAYSTVPYINGQTTQTTGVEFESKYTFNLEDKSKFKVGFQFTRTLSYDMTVDGVTYSLAGTHGPSIIGGNTGNPKDRAQLTLSYEKGPFTISTTTNYIGTYDVTDPSVAANDCASGITSNTAEFANGATAPSQYCTIPSFIYTNLNASYKVTKGLTLRGSITNLFDVQPPVDLNTYGGTGSNSSSSGSGAPYNPSLHQTGAVGRFFSVGMDYKF